MSDHSQPRALLFGSIGVLAETSQIQRDAYNRAFQTLNLDWQWDEAVYRSLLQIPGGRHRLRTLSAATSRELSEDQIEAIHDEKTKLANAEIGRGLQLRPGVGLLIAAAVRAGHPIGIVSGTSRANIEGIASAVGDALPLDSFDVVTTGEDVSDPKPAPALYLHALQRLGLEAHQVVAVEDTAASLASAINAGIATIATPGVLSSDQDFSSASLVLPALGDDVRVESAVLELLGWEDEPVDPS